MIELLFEYDSDEWEGVESIELEEEFGVVFIFVVILVVGVGFKVL